ncbi:hypothetical protein [Bacillus swezeyi]|uniref:hypothetical protein n=1 Tax=Bacillus swezeyi TaxID=1925020 RepID=UPI003F8CF131
MKKKIISFIVAVMMINVVSVSLASANELGDETSLNSDFLGEFGLESETDFEIMSDMLKAIDELPYEIIDKGPDAVAEWLSLYSEDVWLCTFTSIGSGCSSIFRLYSSNTC